MTQDGISIGTRLARTEVRDQADMPALVHHATLCRFDISETAVLTHFGTRAAARERMGGWGGEPHPDARVISAFLDIRNPLYLEDLNDNHSLEKILRLIVFSEADRFIDKAARDAILDYEQETGEGLERLVEILAGHGYDGIGYRNLHEDPGSMSWMIFSSDQIIFVSEGPLCDSHDPWDLDAESWTGPAMISEVFDLDGRDEDYAHLFETLIDGGQDLPVLRRDEAGYEVRWLPDWEPQATMGLFSPAGEPVGFYMGGQLWIDPPERGAGRSALMILAAADLLGGCPAQNQEGLGYSPAGHAAHLAAHRKARSLGIELGYLEDAEDMRP